MSTLKRKDLDLGGSSLSIRQLGVGEFCDAAERESKSDGVTHPIRNAVEVVSLSSGIEASRLLSEFAPGAVIAAYREIMAFSMEGIPATPGKAASP